MKARGKRHATRTCSAGEDGEGRYEGSRGRPDFDAVRVGLRDESRRVVCCYDVGWRKGRP